MSSPLESPEPTITEAFKRHGLIGAVTGVHLLLIFYLVFNINTSISELTAVMRELKTLISERVK